MICVFLIEIMVQNQKILFCISPEELGPLDFRYTILSAIQEHPASRPYGHDSRCAQTKYPKDPTWVVPLPANMSETKQERHEVRVGCEGIVMYITATSDVSYLCHHEPGQHLCLDLNEIENSYF